MNKSKLTIWSLICAIASLILYVVVIQNLNPCANILINNILGIGITFSPIISILLARAALKQIKNNNLEGKGFAYFSLGLGIILLLFFVIIFYWFGILPASFYCADQCLASQGFGCVGAPKAYPDSLQFGLWMNLSSDIYVNNLYYKSKARGDSSCNSFRVCEDHSFNCTANIVRNMSNGQMFSISVENCVFSKPRIQGDVIINYTNLESGKNDIAEVLIYARVRR
jgi:hypothetical protein